ncbi:MAG: thioredoxin family protein [Kofleriaceae bacterium]
MRSLVTPAPLALAACLSLGLGLGACRRAEPPMRSAEATATKTPAAADACAGAKASGPLRWFHDDYGAALACARARKQPLVVDLWAPWCHTCLSMQETVFQDPELAGPAERFVFLALDTDREVNAKAVARMPPGAWPTFYVVSSEDEAVQARFVGAASKAQFLDFLEQGARGASAGTSAGSADDLLRQADRAVVIKDYPAAVTSYKAALTAAPKDWTRRPDALVSLAGAHRRAGDLEACVALGETALGQTGAAASVTDFLVVTLGCADGLPEQAAKRQKAFQRAAAERLTALLADPAAQLSVDDRSDAMMNLRTLQDALGQRDAARATAAAQRALLDDAAAAASSPRAAMTYNWPRAEVYVYLGKGLELVDDLEASAAALPDEYDPPYRLAWTLLQSGKAEEAAAWCDKAKQLVYGPRKARVINLAIDIAVARKDAAAERAGRAELVAMYQALPAEQAAPEALAKAQAALEALDAAAAKTAPVAK